MKKMMSSTQSKELSRSRKGFVLVSVLLLGVLLISCATSFTWFVRMQVRTAGSEMSGLTDRTMATVMVSAVTNILTELSKHVKSDSPSQRWYKPLVMNIPGMGVWVIQITPLDDKIPLGKLFLPDGNTLRRELSNTWRELWDKLGRRELEQTVLDFSDKNNKPRVGGTERDDFINRPVYDISEFLLLSPDIDSSLIYGTPDKFGISDYCTVYSDGKINLNVAPVHVLELLPGLDAGGLAKSIEEYRKDKPLESISDIRSIPGAGARTSNQLMNIAAFKSRYFSVKLECVEEGGNGGRTFNVIIDRNTKQTVRWEEI